MCRLYHVFEVIYNSESNEKEVINFMNAKIIGTGRFIPEYVLTNEELSHMVETSDEWIVSHTGMRERHICRGETTWQMGMWAAQNALENAGVSAEDIDLIIGSSVTQDYSFPPMSCIVQGKIGAKNAFCFDQAAACSGFVFALETARQYIENGRVKTVLVIASEMLSRVTDYTDRSTCVLLGDGAGAVVLQACETGGILSSYCTSDGAHGDLLACRGLINNSPFAEPNEECIPDLKEQFMMMKGHDIYKFAVRGMRDGLKHILEDSDTTIDELAYLVPHQANIRIISSMAEKFNLSMDKVYINLDRYGNTSSATIPIALDELNRDGKIKSGDKIALIAFGGGLTSGAAMIEW